MPRYRLLYRVEGAIRFRNDMTLQNGAHSVRFLAADPQNPEDAVLAQVELEIATHDEAWRLAAGTVISPVLDALSFAAGAPMLLRDCELTLKSEAGSRTRRGIFVRQLRYPNALFADEEVFNVAQQILNTDGPRLPLCWLRYSHQRELALEKYVFAWLGLEELAGDADIEKECPNCGNRVTYRSANRQRAWELFQGQLRRLPTSGRLG